MEFRLTFDGILKSSADAKHKHEKRRVFHPQLRRLWDMHPYLKIANASHEIAGSSPRRFIEADTSLRDYSAQKFSKYGYRFVPLVTEELSLSCALDIVFLRPSMPGELMKSGDIDGRLKTLFDALRMPQTVEELGGYIDPLPDEDPFFVLLEDDKLITHISIKTDALLQPPSSPPNVNDARLMIAVTIRPVKQGWHNIDFGGA